MGVSEGSRRGQRDSNRPAPYEPAVDAYAQGLIDRLQANARDEEALRLLSAHYESHRDYPSLANLLEGWAGTLRDDRRAAAAFVAAGDAVLDGRLDKNRARVLYETAIDRHPESDDALHRLEALLRRLSDDTGHERVLSRMARALERRGAEPMRRADVHYRLGQLYEHRLRLPGKAINEYRTALNLDPQLVPAITAARAIYDAAGKHGAVADMYELEIATITDGEARHDLLIALATHQRDFLEDLEAAVRAVRRALKAQPSRTGTLELLADLAQVGLQPRKAKVRIRPTRPSGPRPTAGAQPSSTSSSRDVCRAARPRRTWRPASRCARSTTRRGACSKSCRATAAHPRVSWAYPSSSRWMPT